MLYKYNQGEKDACKMESSERGIFEFFEADRTEKISTCYTIPQKVNSFTKEHKSKSDHLVCQVTLKEVKSS